jgi:hypothetical protein
MRSDFRRDTLRILNDLRSSGLSRAFELHIEQKPVGSDPAAQPFDSSMQPNRVTDTIIYGTCIFIEIKNQDDPQSTGSVIKRKGKILIHPRYESFFRKADLVKVGGVRGQFIITGVTSPDPSGLEIMVYLESRQ